MKRLLYITTALLFLAGCTSKEELPARNDPNQFPSSSQSLPATLAGRWIRTTRLQTFDYKPEEWVPETNDAAFKKYLHFNSDKSYESNQLDCSTCKVELLNDTLYLTHSEGFYKFPVLLHNDTLLEIRTHVDQPAYSLPNTGLFDFVLEEKYRKQ